MIEGILGRLLAIILILGLLLASVVVGGAYYIKNRIVAENTVQNEGVFIIPAGSGSGRVINALGEQGFISSGRFFPPSDDLVLLFGIKSKLIEPQIKAGEYQITKGLSLEGLMAYLSTSSNAVLHQVTIPEGWRSSQILERLNNNDYLHGVLPNALPEGRYLADTWSFERGTQKADLLEKMAQAQDKLLDELWDNRAEGLPFSTKREAVILASIVERETAKDEELGIVAGVYINRLKKGMKLDADPTVAYGVGKFGSDNPLTRSDLRDSNNPYNTYQHKGLPPGPIANPGRGAIEAVLNPVKSDYIFFVADGTGGHVFAKTYKEHQQNVAKWREIEKNQ